MKKFIILCSVVFGIFLYATDSQAVTVSSGPNANEIKARYAGSFLVIDNNFSKQYWYVHPDSQEKYLVKNGVFLSQLLPVVGVGISNNDLEKIAKNSQDENVDYELSYKMRGQILLQVEKDGQAWYVNPIDLYRYPIANGNDGFDAIVKLALDIDYVKLNAIPTVDNNNFILHDDSYIDFEMYNIVKKSLEDNFYKPERINDLDLFYGSLNGLAQSTKDPYTQFFSPLAKENFQKTIEGEVEGIGAIVETVNNRLIIVSPLEDSPAINAGLKPLDQIWKVNGTDIYGYSTTESTDLIKGPAGTNVVLEIYRPSTETYFEVSITRQKLDLKNVTAKTLDNNIAYFKINMFSLSLLKEFNNLQKFFIKDDTKGVIIDLRNNPGGYSFSAINLADKWLDDNSLIVKEKYRDQTKFYSSRLSREIDLPTVILINEGTASAAEIFTSALLAYDEAKTVGHTSYGKGTGQSLLTFADDSALKYTIFEWFDPQDNSVEGKGLTPNYLIDNDEQKDWQLQKARDLLK